MTNEMYREAKAIVSAKDNMQDLLDIVKWSNCVTITVASDKYEDAATAKIHGEFLERFKEVLIDEVSRLEKEFEML